MDIESTKTPPTTIDAWRTLQKGLALTSSKPALASFFEEELLGSSAVDTF